MTRKRICFINTSKIWGGGENWQFETILDFKDRCEVVTIVDPKSTLCTKVQNEGIKTFPFKVGNLSFLNPLALLRAYLLLRNIAPGVILFNTAPDFKLFTFPAKWAGVECRLYRRDNGKPLKKHLLNRIWLGKGITHFLPCSDFILKSALSKKADLISAEKIRVIHNSINLSKWDSLKPAKLELSESACDFIFGCIGRLSHEKGQLFLPRAVNKLAERHSNFKVLIAGTGPVKEELEYTIETMGLEKYFEVLGFVESNKAFLDAIDCLLIPSKWEGLPTVAIEAMALKKPVISFNVAGNPEIVKNGENGYLVSPFDTNEFANRMEEMIKNPDLMNQMGQNGRELVECKFSKNTTNKLLQEYF